MEPLCAIYSTCCTERLSHVDVSAGKTSVLDLTVLVSISRRVGMGLVGGSFQYCLALAKGITSLKCCNNGRRGLNNGLSLAEVEFRRVSRGTEAAVSVSNAVFVWTYHLIADD